MGSSASKAARKYPGRGAAGSVRRAAQQDVQPSSPKAPLRKSRAREFSRPTDSVRADGMDPDPPTSAAFSDRLRQIGAVQPNPTLSHSSTAMPGSQSSLSGKRRAPLQNSTIFVLEARLKVQERAEAEFKAMGRPGHAGREFLDVSTLREALVMRFRGSGTTEIETKLNLRQGTVAKLGLIGATGGGVH